MSDEDNAVAEATAPELMSQAEASAEASGDRIAIVDLASGRVTVGPADELQPLINAGDARLASAAEIELAEPFVRIL